MEGCCSLRGDWPSGRKGDPVGGIRGTRLTDHRCGSGRNDRGSSASNWCTVPGIRMRKNSRAGAN